MFYNLPYSIACFNLNDLVAHLTTIPVVDGVYTCSPVLANHSLEEKVKGL